MSERLYADLAPLWPLFSPPAHYREEAVLFRELLEEARGGPVRSLLDLGSGGGSLSANFPREIEVVLVDRSEAMLEQSRQVAVGREHVRAEIEAVRLGRTFDAVLLHDAVMYLTSREALVAAFRTAAAHLEPGGAFLVVPDLLRESFEEGIDVGDGRRGEIEVQMMEWRHDPDPQDDTFQVDFAFLIKESGEVRVAHDQHIMGLFDRATFVTALEEAGFDLVALDPYRLLELPGEPFLAKRR